VLSRPELALLALAAATVGVARAELRQATSRALVSFTAALAVVLAGLRPPLGEIPIGTLAVASLAAAVAGAVFLVATRAGSNVGIPLVAGAVVTILFLVAVTGFAPGIRHWGQNDWPLLAAALGGCFLAATTRRLRTPVCAIVLAAGLLAFAYVLKNPAADRYLSLLTPLVAVLASLPAAASIRAQRRIALVATGGLVGTTLALGGLPALAPDGFPTIARQLEALNGPSLPIVTAAPDAYGVLLADRPVRIARPGLSGLIVVDGAMRAYDPELRLSARTLATLDPGAGFLAPDGVIDSRPVRLKVGRVVGARGVVASGP
jgi:hypothetical protein